MMTEACRDIFHSGSYKIEQPSQFSVLLGVVTGGLAGFLAYLAIRGDLFRLRRSVPLQNVEFAPIDNELE